ncbi:MAG: enoyl-CoA hydratase/isomerase family protein [Acidimicrobiales bacterium]|nr:enoyl-CoA hydratase/isomerase family protein [Acidimicrobiales bacterium]
MPDTDRVLIDEVDDDILTVTLNRPDTRNALSASLIQDLHQTFEAIAYDRTTRVVILTGAGKGFCSGADTVGDGSSAPGADGTGPTVTAFAYQEFLAALHERMTRSRKPIIAAVNGAAVGGGFSLSLACDIRFAAESARFGAIFITKGVSACDMGTSYFLPRLVGASRSMELMLTGRIFDAAEALDMGLVLDVVPDGQVVDRALETARLIRANAPLATWMTKETMWQSIDAPSLRHALDLENRTQIMCSGTGEIREAFQAFNEGRTPSWRGL